MSAAGKMIFLFLILLGIQFWIKKVLNIEKDNKKIENTLKIMEQSYTELQEQIDAVRKYRHDIPKHLHIMEEAVSDNSDRKYCEDELLNTIACIKAEKCLEQNINLKIGFDLKEKEILTKLPIEKVDFSGLVQNLLDNATEECSRIPETFEREIVWTISQTSEGIEMQVENTCNNTEKIDFVTQKEDKKAHGWGVKIIKETVNAAGGRIDYIKEGRDRICAEVFLPFVQ